jgi:hypothetical protein
VPCSITDDAHASANHARHWQRRLIAIGQTTPRENERTDMSSSKKDRPGYDVGYAKPPEHTRYKPGRSGNPRGRPKGVRNFSTDVKQTSRMPVVLVEGGKKRRTSTQVGVLLKLRELALKGNQRALDKLLDLIARYNDEAAPSASTETMLAEDRAIVADYEARVIARHEAKAAETRAAVSRSTKKSKSRRRTPRR